MTGKPAPVTVASQRAVAEAAGVSQMTVSRVLRGDGRVAAATVTRVRAAVNAVGYVPNPLVTALMRSRRSRAGGAARSLGLAWHGVPSALRPADRAAGLDDPYADILAGAESVCARHGCRLELFPMTAGDHRVPRIVRARGLGGVLLAPIGPGRKRAFGPPELGDLPVVSLAADAPGPMGQRVSNDSFSAMQLCLRALAGAGCRRIGFVDSARHQAGSGDRWLGAFLAGGFRGLELVPPQLANFRRAEAPEYLAQYVRRQTPDGLVVGSRTLLQCLADQVAEGRLRVAFAALECGGWPSWISGARTDFHALGAEAAQLLLQQVLAPGDRPAHARTLLVAPQWHEGRSHRPGGAPVGTLPAALQ